MRKLLLGTAAVAFAVPTIAIAGKAVTAGDQSLQVFVQLKPTSVATPGKGGVNFGMRVSYKSLNDGAQIKENIKSVTLNLPKGMKIHPDRAGSCLVSELADQGEDACPASALIGAGTGTVDARPTLADPVDAELRVYNTLDDTNSDGSIREEKVPAITLYAKTTIGVNTALPFDLVGDGVLRLDFAPPADPSKPPLYHVQDVKFGVPLQKGKAYFTRPGKCPKGYWGFKMTIDNYDGPPVTAGHKVTCSQGG